MSAAEGELSHVRCVTCFCYDSDVVRVADGTLPNGECLPVLWAVLHRGAIRVVTKSSGR